LKTNGGQTFTIQLSGAGTDFTSTGSSGTSVSLTVSAGDTATLPLTFTAMGGFSGTVSISCALTKPAPGVVCNTPANFTLTGTTTQNVTFTTTTRNVASGVAVGSRSGIGIALSITFGAIVMLFAGRTRRFARQAGLLLVLLGVTFAAIGCGDNKPSTNPLGTPAGAYTYTVTSTSGSLSHSVVVTLNVQ
jgi:multidrug transporter EmrE-like cation transporter